MFAISQQYVCRLTLLNLTFFSNAHSIDRVIQRFSGRKGSALSLGPLRKIAALSATSVCQVSSTNVNKPRRILSHSINAVGVDIAPFSTMSHEEEVLLLPCLPLMNRAGKNPEPDLWDFDIESPRASSADMKQDLPPVMIDYIHPGGEYLC